MDLLIKENSMKEPWSIISSMKPFIQEAWKKAEFQAPTPIQLKATPLILEGKDVLAESPTGTGKTLAYLLPALEKLSPENKSIQIVIMASSHELVMQIHEEFQKWSQGSDLSAATFIGGANVKRQLDKLKKHPQLIIGTPGRILELIKQKKMKMHEVKTIVLDEGDQLLVPEHIHTVKEIIKATLKDRQIVLFSATLPESTEAISKEFMNNPTLIKIDRTEIENNESVEHIYFVSEMREKIDILASISRLESAHGLVFVKDIASLSVLAERLEYNRISVGVLHSDADKTVRQAALKNFRAGKFPLLLATDVAARGLDIQDITHVVHFDLPRDITEYTHRSGRTGRLGSTMKGTVISLVTDREERELKQFSRKLNIPVAEKEFYKGQIVDKRVKWERKSSNGTVKSKSKTSGRTMTPKKGKKKSK